MTHEIKTEKSKLLRMYIPQNRGKVSQQQGWVAEKGQVTRGLHNTLMLSPCLGTSRHSHSLGEGWAEQPQKTRYSMNDPGNGNEVTEDTATAKSTPGDSHMREVLC